MSNKDKSEEDTAIIHERLAALEQKLIDTLAALDKNQSRPKGKWLGILCAIGLGWTAWVSGSIFSYGISIREMRLWQESRPKFVTTEQQETAMLREEKALRDLFTTKIDDRFKTIYEGQQKLLDSIISLDKKMVFMEKALADHVTAQPK